MSDPWVLVAPGALAGEGPVEIEKEEGRHLVRVLRRRVGDPVVLADGAGRTARAEVSEVVRDRVVVVAGTPVVHDPATGRSVDVALAVINGTAMDWAVQKAVEVGARRFLPWVADRSQGGGKSLDRRLDHWRRVAQQAIKQCQRAYEMEVLEPIDLDGLIDRPPARPVLADSSGVNLRNLGLMEEDVMLVVGPEGGFTDDELRRIAVEGWPAVRLGPHVLRAETAVAVGVAALVLA